jgi:hypothetical protein
MAKAKEKKHKEEKFQCPVGRFFEDLEGLHGGSKSEFFDHLNKSRLEFLRAIRSLVDEKIEHMEKKGAKKKKKATKIKVE